MSFQHELDSHCPRHSGDKPKGSSRRHLPEIHSLSHTSSKQVGLTPLDTAVLQQNRAGKAVQGRLDVLIPVQDGGSGCQKNLFSICTQVILASPCRAYPGLHWKMMESPASLLSPLRLPFWGIPGSLQEVAVETESIKKYIFNIDRFIFNTGLQHQLYLDSCP